MAEASTTPTTSNAINTPPPQTNAGVAPSSTEPVNPGSWMAGFNDELKGYTTNKGWKGPSELAESYRNLEKLQGVPQDRLLKLPDKFYGDDGKLTQEGRSIYERLGAPKESKDYGFKPAEGGDKNLVEAFAKACHENGISKSSAEKMFNELNGFSQSQAQALKDAQVAKFRDSEASLKKEWGAAYEQNINIAKEGMLRLGMSAAEIDSLSSTLGHDKTMKLLKNLGSSVGEHAFVTGRQPATAMEPATAKAKIKELMGDTSWYKRLEAGGVEEKAEWDRLHKYAFQGNVNFG